MEAVSTEEWWNLAGVGRFLGLLTSALDVELVEERDPQGADPPDPC